MGSIFGDKIELTPSTLSKTCVGKPTHTYFMQWQAPRIPQGLLQIFGFFEYFHYDWWIISGRVHLKLIAYEDG
jgi:hypothetical protein